MCTPKTTYIILHKMFYAESDENSVVALNLFDVRYSLDSAIISALQGIKAIVKRAETSSNPLPFQAHDADFAVRVVVPQVHNKNQLCEHTMLVYNNRGIKYGEDIELLRKYVKTSAERDMDKSLYPDGVDKNNINVIDCGSMEQFITDAYEGCKR